MYSNKSKRKKRTSIFKLFSIFLLLILLGFTTNIYLNSKYESLISEFYNKFNSYDYSNAKTVLNNKVLLLKKNKLNNDLSNYFTDIVDKICSSLTKNEIDSTYALEILNEIKNYNILNSSLDDLIIALDSNYVNITPTPNNSSLGYNEDSYLNLGISAFNENEYELALEYFYSIPESSTDYEIAIDYINEYESNYKNYLFKSIEGLVANKYYTNAINILSDYNKNLLTEDEVIEIENKISSIKLFREEYDEEYDAEYTANAILTEITPININSFSISSKTPYLIYLSLDKQKTYIYEGSNNNWNLLKEFDSSTGIEGKETPKGIFQITNRGEWFFAEEFQQGGKYWIQFMGDYLFHSVPFDETKENVLDYTLGTPASHGCIRLAVEDAKWMYDNLSNDTKIIIN